MEYTDKEAIENYLVISIDPGFDSQITEWIEAMSAYIDLVTGRTFEVPTTDTTKKYDGNNTNCLLIDDVLEVTTVEIDDTSVDLDDVLGYPANSTPKTRMVLKSNVFTQGLQNIEITGKFGYGTTIPQPIKWATTVLVAGIVNNAYQSEGEVQQETIGRYSVTYKSEKEINDFEEAKKIIKLYRKPAF